MHNEKNNVLLHLKKKKKKRTSLRKRHDLAKDINSVNASQLSIYFQKVLLSQERPEEYDDGEDSNEWIYNKLHKKMDNMLHSL